MIKEKQLVKVVGTCITGVGAGRLDTTMGRGIIQLKRGITILELIKSFLAERHIVHCTLNQRSEDTWTTTPIMFVAEDPKIVLSYVFTVFPLSEIGYFGKDLSKTELIRDFKFLKGLLK